MPEGRKKSQPKRAGRLLEQTNCPPPAPDSSHSAPGIRGKPVPAVTPPSTTKLAPVINDASSEARKVTVLAISSGSPILPTGCAAPITRRNSSARPLPRISAARVLIAPVTHAVYPDAVFRILECRGASQIDYRGFRRIVRCHPVIAMDARNRGGIYYGAATLPAHDWDGIFQSQESARERHRNNTLP